MYIQVVVTYLIVLIQSILWSALAVLMAVGSARVFLGEDHEQRLIELFSAPSAVAVPRAAPRAEPHAEPRAATLELNLNSVLPFVQKDKNVEYFKESNGLLNKTRERLRLTWPGASVSSSSTSTEVENHVRAHRCLFEKHMPADIKAAMERVCVVIADENTPLTLHPKLKHLHDVKTADGRDYKDIRGIGATLRHPVVGIGKETLNCGKSFPTSTDTINYVSAPASYSRQSLLLHELSHAVMDVALVVTRPDLYDRIHECYEKALVKYEEAKDAYRYLNAQEYFAENVEAFFESSKRYRFKEGIATTRDELRVTDPCLFEILKEVFGENADSFRLCASL